MRRSLPALAAIGLISCAVLAEEARWPSFRGPNGSGVAERAKTVETWDVESGRNIRWKTAIPGLGLSSPVIWDDRLFISTATNEDDDAELRVGLYGDIMPSTDNDKHRWSLFCLDRNTGKVLWERVAHQGEPKIKRHPKSSHANATPATDGQRVVVSFGSEGLYCYSMDGELLWKKDLGVLDGGYYLVKAAQWAFGSSPVLHDGRVIVQCDVQDGSFVAAFDAKDGAELWRTPRDEVPGWGTPTVVVSGDRAQVVCNGYKHIGGYDLKTGAELWKLRGGGDIPVPTPISAHGLTYITNAHGRMAPVYAIKLTASGDITPADEQDSNEHIPWLSRRHGNYMQTPIVVGDELFCCNDAGLLTRFDAKTGESKQRMRLTEERLGFTASPVYANGRLYYTSEEGDVIVLKVGAELEKVASNKLGESCMASAAIAGDTLYFRARRHVIAIGQDKAQ